MRCDHLVDFTHSPFTRAIKSTVTWEALYSDYFDLPQNTAYQGVFEIGLLGGALVVVRHFFESFLIL
jgi:hypothetical protein